MPIEVGTLLESRYRIIKTIGHGGTADVFLANDIINKTDLAIKVLKDDLIEDQEVLENFRKEVTILSCLSSAHIVKVYGYYLYENRPYIINEYVKGNTLKDLLDLRGYLPIEEAIDYMIQLTQALMPAHAKGVIHRDIKPLNIFILNDGTLKLADFGIAQIGKANSIENPTSIVGSVHYLAPEIVKGKPACLASDIYACGIVFYEMLTGQVPFRADNAVDTAVAHVKEKFPSIRKILPTCPKEIEAIINKCTMKEPNNRYLNVEDFYNALCSVKRIDFNKSKKKGFFARLFGRKK
ncbi:MAG: protein kinase [Bacilli bacterium]|nr:protein kinase [Bacilli bacterium]